jgi:hypothetical protein
MMEMKYGRDRKPLNRWLSTDRWQRRGEEPTAGSIPSLTYAH